MTTSEPPAPPSKACPKCGQGFDEKVSYCPQDGSLLARTGEDPLLGTLFADRYEILSVLGQGGMGTVYRARHRFMERLVAIKMVHPDYITNETNLQRFQQEAKAAASLSHPNIITVYDFGMTLSNLPYLVMDYLQGMTLSDLITESGCADVLRSIDLFEQICRALAHAHKRGIIHRDLKPSNIMIVAGEDGEDVVKLVDFGIAKLLPHPDRMAQRLTQTGELFGSPLYMSPEQCMGEELGIQSDIYSLGCLMYETLTGKPAISGPNIMATIYAHVSQMPAPLSRANPDRSFPKELEHLVLKALAKGRDDRHQSADDLRQELAHVAGRLRKEPAPAEDLASPAGGGGGDLSVDQMMERLSSLNDDAAISYESEMEVLDHLEDSEKEFGADSIRLLPAVQDVIKFYRDRERQDEAERYAIRAVELLEAEGDSLDLAMARCTHAKICMALGRYPDARQLYENALTLIEECAGPVHYSLIYPLGDLGLICERMGEFAAAEASYERAVDTATRVYGRDDPEVANTLDLLGLFLLYRDEFERADEAFAEALEILVRSERDHPDWAFDVLTHASSSKRRAGALDEALDLARKALELAGAQFGADSPRTADAMLALGYIYELKDEPRMAEKLYRKALAQLEEFLNPMHQELAYPLGTLAMFCSGQGRVGEAAALYERAVSIVELSAGHEHVRVATPLRGLAIVNTRRGKYEEAEEQFLRVAELEERGMGPWSDDLEFTIRCLADLYLELGRFDEAEAMYRRSLTIAEKLTGLDHPLTASPLRGLLAVLKAVDRQAEAEAIQRRLDNLEAGE